MDLIFNLLKQLAASLSTTEFLLVLALVGLSSWTVLKFVLKHSKAKGGILALFTSDDPKVRTEHYKESIEDILNLRKDFTASTTQILREMEDINYQFKMHYQHDQQSHETVKELIKRINESVDRIFTQLEKSDEFFRTTVPEFRTYHKDLSKELSNLGRDVTLIERGIQTQINTQNAVKLR